MVSKRLQGDASGCSAKESPGIKLGFGIDHNKGLGPELHSSSSSSSSSSSKRPKQLLRDYLIVFVVGLNSKGKFDNNVVCRSSIIKLLDIPHAQREQIKTKE